MLQHHGEGRQGVIGDEDVCDLAQAAATCSMPAPVLAEVR